MKRLTFILLAFFSICIQAQPVLNISDFDENLSLNIYGFSMPTFDPGLSGENQVWDFSSISLNTSTAVLSISDVTNTPYATSFLDSNYCEIYSLNGEAGLFQYYNKESSKFELAGYVNVGSSVTNYSNFRTLFQFPFTYGLSVNDLYSVCQGCGNNETVISYDAYGTLVTSFGTFTDVIRKKTINLGDTSYEWFKVNPYTPILYANMHNIPSIMFYIPTNLSNSQNNFNSFSIFPNPTNGNLSIKNVNSIDKEVVVTVYDVLGNAIIKNKELNSTIENIDLSDFSSGLYFVKIADKNNQLLYSDKIIKH